MAVEKLYEQREALTTRLSFYTLQFGVYVCTVWYIHVCMCYKVDAFDTQVRVRHSFDLPRLQSRCS
jgi:hypothetical protein